MTSRFWEMASGCLIFLYEDSLNKKFAIYKDKLSFACFLFLIIIFFIPIQYGYISTFFVVVITSIFLIVLKDNNFINSIFISSYSVYLGKISYSLYLWHWGILSISLWTFGVNSKTFIFQIVLILLLSIFSYRFIESPFRNNKFLFDKIQTFLFSLISIILILIPLRIQSLRESFIYIPRIFNLDKIFPNKAWDSITCHGMESLKKIKTPYKYCLKTMRENKNDKRLYLIGDSHAAQFIFMFRKVLKDQNYKIGFISNDSNYDFPQSFFKIKNAINKSDTIKNIIQNSRKNDIVAISFHRGYLNKNNYRDLHVSKHSDNINTSRYITTKNNYIQLIENLNKKNIKILLIKDTTLLKKDIPIEACQLQEKFFDWNACDVSVEQDNLTRAAQDNLFDFLSNKYSNVFTWDPRKEMELEGGQLSFYNKKGEIIMKDNHHISQQFSESLAPKFKNFLFSKIIN